MTGPEPNYRTLLKNAVVEIQRLQAEARAWEKAANEPIAVVGMGCRFPGGVNSARTFWELLESGRDAIREIPEGRWDRERFYDPNPEAGGRSYARHGGFLDGVDLFDPDFFGISRREAEAMDPQQRLLLEVGWETLENAGQCASELAGSKTGVYAGICFNDYAQLTERWEDCGRVDAYSALGGAHSIGVGRLSYFLGLRGPNIQIDTACSSSLVAVHLACQGLRSGECDLAFAGGVNLLLSPVNFVAFSKMRALSPDGRCKTFDARADGYGRGEGCGLVLLKKLSDAERDGNRILGVIRGSAVNHDGRTNGLTAPNGLAQREVIEEALKRAGMMPREVGYVEAHGTGTALGDPIEALALAEALGKERDTPLWVGTVKTNFGHLEAAAGVAGLIKAIISMQRGKIPPHLHFQKPNPHIPFETLGLRIAAQLTDWPGAGGRLAAGVSSFGMSGTNAHVIVEFEPAPAAPERRTERPIPVLAVSARTEGALRNLAGRYAEELAGTPEQEFADVCFTAHTGRTHFEHRLVVAEESLARARSRLTAFAAGKSSPAAAAGKVRAGEKPKAAFLFPGQGSQHAGMGRQLYEVEPVFRGVLDRCDRILREPLGGSIIQWMFAAEDQEGRMEETLYVQPALFSIEFALAELWRSWGIEPDAVLGHSLGEYAAACVAGVFDLEAGLGLIARRARLMDGLPKTGCMAVVHTGLEKAARELAGEEKEVSIAACNSPEMTVLSGEGAVVEKILIRLAGRGIRHQRLGTSRAYHSPFVEPILGEFEDLFASMPERGPKIPLASNLTGGWWPESRPMNGAYWAAHLRQPVQFAAGMRALMERGFRIFLECGPGTALQACGKRCVPKALAGEPWRWVASLRQESHECRTMADALAQFYAAGVTPDWRGYEGVFSRRRCELPAYPFERSRYWLDASARALTQRREEEGALWLEVVKKGREAAMEGLKDAEYVAERAKFEALNKYAEVLIREGLARIGEGEVQGRGILPEYGRCVEGWRERFGSVAPAGETPEVLWEKASEIWGSEVELPALVRRCGTALADILTGGIDPLGIFFPDGSSVMVEKFYRDYGLARYCNGIMGGLLRGRLSMGGPCKVLEVGGGTGGTTATLLPIAAEHQSRYRFTDIGVMFAREAARKFGSVGGFESGVLDIEKGLEPQGIERGAYDVVVASNVLHATRNLGEALDHARTALAPGGLLLLWEATELQPFLDLTFGLLPGWRRFEKDPLRPTQPLLNAAQWKRALEERGFSSVEIFPSIEDPRSRFGQHVIVARAAAEAVVGEARRGKDLAGEAGEGKEGGHREVHLELNWEERALVSGRSEEGEGGMGAWVVLGDEGEATRRFMEFFRGTKHPVALVKRGERFEETGPMEFAIRPCEAADYERLFRETGFGGSGLAVGFLYLWGASAAALEAEAAGAVFERTLNESVLPLLRLLETLGDSASEFSVRCKRVYAATRGVHAVGGSVVGEGGPFQAFLWGLGRTAALEMPGIWGGLIDLDPEAAVDDPERLVEWMANGGEKEASVRAGKFFAPRLRRIARDSAAKGGFQCSVDGAYLITGGRGGIGLKLADWLVGKGARRLILAGRKELPPRRRWAAHIAQGLEHAETLGAILALEAKGASVVLAALDVGDRAAVFDFARRYREENWPGIRGVFHAAGATDDAGLPGLDRKALEGVWNPKAVGALNLAECFRGADFIVFFSSAAAIFGSALGGNYASANAFADVLAIRERQRGFPVVSINWGPWENTGMAKVDRREERLARRGFLPIPSGAALEALESVLVSPAAQRIILDLDLERCGQTHGESPLLKGLREARSKTIAVPEAEDAGAGDRGGEAVLRMLTRDAAGLLQAEKGKLDSSVPLAAYGFDSIMAVQWKNEIENKFGVSISLAELAQNSLEQTRDRVLHLAAAGGTVKVRK